MKQKALFIFNPKSGTGDFTFPELKEKVLANLDGFELVDFETTGENDPQKIRDQINQLTPDLILVGGGDGTVKLVAENLEKSIPMAILPLGSANGLAKCLGIDLLEDGLDALRKMMAISMDAIEINGELCLHLADFGFNAKLIEGFEQQEGRGMLGYIKSSFSQLFITEKYPFQIQTNDRTWELETRMLLIANGDRFGTGAVINPNGKLDDGKFEIVTLNIETFDDLLDVSKSLISGDMGEGEGIQSWSLTSCKIINKAGVKFQIDGELKGNPDEIEVAIHPGRFQFITRMESTHTT
ncbi:diacylglycerol/lipid kinase family protein [Algoriphagus hitonicola]|uniref:Diacylglycerol kinase family enzyme n=1 Tax=Algoriphagus hitonicola TaxID=435880 RepID=A0A1I2T0J0_9BACT|nr:diacylglycerol kinase family protein [Algoriphagus hitonicola]SFG55731.1 Diacylglycerol kinase family enzyme [Algoriphagus hitonicola]